MTSSRLGLTLVAMAVSAAVLAGSALVGVQVQRNALATKLDADLLARAGQIELSLAGGIFSEEVADPRSADWVIQIVDILDRVVASSPNLDGVPPIGDWRPGFQTLESLPFTDVPYRVLTVETTRTAEPFTVHVGASYETVAEATAILTRYVLVAVPALTLILGVLAWVLVGVAQRRPPPTIDTTATD